MDWQMQLRFIVHLWLDIGLFLFIEQDIGLVSAWHFDLFLENIQNFYLFLMEQRLRRVAFEFGGRLRLFNLVLLLQMKDVECVVDLHLLNSAHFDLFGVRKRFEPASYMTYILKFRR